MTASLAAVLWVMAGLVAVGEGSKSDLPIFPPFTATPGERAVSDGADFSVCDEALQTFVTSSGWTITSRRYSVTQLWGNMIRAKVTSGDGSDFPVICWLNAIGRAQILFDRHGTSAVPP